MAENGGGSSRERSRSRPRSAIAATSDAIVQGPAGAAGTLEAMLDEVVTLHDDLVRQRAAIAAAHSEEIVESQAAAADEDTQACGESESWSESPVFDELELDMHEADLCEKVAVLVAAFNSRVPASQYTTQLKDDMDVLITDLKMRETSLRAKHDATMHGAQFPPTLALHTLMQRWTSIHSTARNFQEIE